MLDASALLAYLKDEPGSEVVEEALGESSHVSAANWAEVLSKLAEEGDDIPRTIERFEAEGMLGWSMIVHPLDEVQAWRIATLRPITRSAGLSLGDRACLSLAEALDLPALTTDRAWGTLEVGIPVRLIR